MNSGKGWIRRVLRAPGFVQPLLTSTKDMPPDTPILTPLFLRNFGGLVIGCIDTSDSESRRIFQHLSRSTRFTFLCTAPNSKI